MAAEASLFSHEIVLPRAKVVTVVTEWLKCLFLLG